MKKILIIFSSITFFFGCDSATAPDCLKSRGDTVVEDFQVGPFNAVEVNEDFNVIIKQGPEQAVKLITGENLLKEMLVEVNSGLLVLTDNNSCKWVRDLDFPTVEITHPNLTTIRQNGGGKISSDGNLSYPELFLESIGSSGDFVLSLTCDQLVIENNELSNYYLDGNVGTLILGIYAGDSRFEGQNLSLTNASILHRGSNDIFLNVSNRLSGVIGGTGDAIYVGQRPQIIEVEANNRGNLIDGTGD